MTISLTCEACRNAFVLLTLALLDTSSPFAPYKLSPGVTVCYSYIYFLMNYKTYRHVYLPTYIK